MKVTFRKLGIALGIVSKGCIATTRDGHRCTRKAFPFCKAHDPEQTIVRPRRLQNYTILNNRAEHSNAADAPPL